LTSITTEKTNTIIFPLPIDIMTTFLSKASEAEKSK